MRTKKEMKDLKETVFNELVFRSNEYGYGIFNHLLYSRDRGNVGEKTIRRITQMLEDEGKIKFHGVAYSKKVSSGSVGVIYEIIKPETKEKPFCSITTTELHKERNQEKEEINRNDPTKNEFLIAALKLLEYATKKEV